MSLPDNLAFPPMSDCQFYHENLPSIGVVHGHMAQVAQHGGSTSPLPSPLHQVHHPQVGGHQGHIYAVTPASQSPLEPSKFGFKHNQGGALVLGQNHSQANFSPQRQQLVPHGDTAAGAPAVRHQQQQHQYNRTTWRRRKRSSLPVLSHSWWKAKWHPSTPTAISPSWRSFPGPRCTISLPLFFSAPLPPSCCCSCWTCNSTYILSGLWDSLPASCEPSPSGDVTSKLDAHQQTPQSRTKNDPPTPPRTAPIPPPQNQSVPNVMRLGRLDNIWKWNHVP